MVRQAPSNPYAIDEPPYEVGDQERLDDLEREVSNLLKMVRELSAAVERLEARQLDDREIIGRIELFEDALKVERMRIDAAILCATNGSTNV